MPDMRTLKAYGKAVGLKILHMKKAKTEEDLAEMILDAYDPEEEENYPPELIEFYQAMRGEEETEEPEEEAEEEVEEESEEKSQVYAWLIETGYEEEDISDLEEADLISLLKETYQDTDTREELPDEAVAYLKEHFPELFPKPKRNYKNPWNKPLREVVLELYQKYRGMEKRIVTDMVSTAIKHKDEYPNLKSWTVRRFATQQVKTYVYQLKKERRI